MEPVHDSVRELALSAAGIVIDRTWRVSEERGVCVCVCPREKEKKERNGERPKGRNREGNQEVLCFFLFFIFIFFRLLLSKLQTEHPMRITWVWQLRHWLLLPQEKPDVFPCLFFLLVSLPYPGTLILCIQKGTAVFPHAIQKCHVFAGPSWLKVGWLVLLDSPIAPFYLFSLPQAFFSMCPAVALSFCALMFCLELCIWMAFWRLSHDLVCSLWLGGCGGALSVLIIIHKGLWCPRCPTHEHRVYERKGQAWHLQWPHS